ncbi:MAG: Ig-like domain-containing protein, partial [Planctomycetaceae bacterium]|nr:Ig-like domain-containing protein [Planctomycetaceae bacterium]
LLSGCSRSRPDDLPKLVPVTLTITQEGKPLSGATVNLSAIEQNSVYTAAGTTDANGVCLLYTHGQYKGSPLGKFKVRVSRTEIIPKPSPRPKSAAEYEAAMKKSRTDPPKTYQFVEEIYTNANTTPLEIEITGTMQKTFDVGKAVKKVVP